MPTAVRVRCGLEVRAVVGLALVLLVAVALAAHHFLAGRPQEVGVPPLSEPGPTAPRASAAPGAPRPSVPTLPPSPAASGAESGVVVHVAGEVRRPGLRTLPPGSRVGDALGAAGGALPGSDTDGLNLARVLGDGEQVVVGAPAPAGSPVTTPAASGPGPGPISLSTATAEQLDSLPGVGPVLAQHIIDYRTQHGGFTTVDQLREVTGIGERRFTDLRPLVRA
ncbi:DNA-binding protein [Wenjunlia vitaminophila]|uniref:DNA-binding protein n=1 Tax=Wenjunlia vitaminophila TaxID=76728 RepID=A0A0T6LLI1_WENVI|nr:DNA-binding protein [Wenjunlia vitaminophila]